MKPRRARARPSRLERTAYHEAGHAVAAYLRGRRFTRISIVPDAGTLGQCVFGQKPLVLQIDVEAFQRVRNRIETLIMVSLAGVVAECMLAGRRNWRGAHHDLHDAAAYGAYVTASQDELRAYLNWLWTRTENLLGATPHWHAVRALAGELLERGTVGERLARSVIAGALERHARRRRRAARTRS